MKSREIFLEKKKPTGSFVEGFKATFSALPTIFKKKGMLRFFVIPFLLNLFLLTGIFYFAFTVIYDPLFSLVEGDTWYFQVIQKILAPLLFFILGIIIVLIYSIMGSIIAAPFNDFLSLKVEQMRTGETFDEKFSTALFIKDITRISKNILKLLGFLIGVNLLLLLLNLLPLAGSLLYSVFSFMATAFFFGFQFFDFPLERRRFEFGDKLKITWRYKFMVIGVGTSFFLITFIPVVGFLGLNLGTVGATELFIDHIKPVLKIGSPGTPEKLNNE